MPYPVWYPQTKKTPSPPPPQPRPHGDCFLHFNPQSSILDTFISMSLHQTAQPSTKKSSPTLSRPHQSRSQPFPHQHRTKMNHALPNALPKNKDNTEALPSTTTTTTPQPTPLRPHQRRNHHHDHQSFRASTRTAHQYSITTTSTSQPRQTISTSAPHTTNAMPYPIHCPQKKPTLTPHRPRQRREHHHDHLGPADPRIPDLVQTILVNLNTNSNPISSKTTTTTTKSSTSPSHRPLDHLAHHNQRTPLLLPAIVHQSPLAHLEFTFFPTGYSRESAGRACWSFFLLKGSNEEGRDRTRCYRDVVRECFQGTCFESVA
jgi:hypothetical protein